MSNWPRSTEKTRYLTTRVLDEIPQVEWHGWMRQVPLNPRYRNSETASCLASTGSGQRRAEPRPLPRGPGERPESFGASGDLTMLNRRGNWGKLRDEVQPAARRRVSAGL